MFKSAPTLRTFKGGWQSKKRGGKWTDGDLQRAGIRVEDDRGHTVDLHGLRTAFISWLGFYGVDPRAQSVLARQPPKGVTLRNYQDFNMFDLWGEMAKPPSPR